MAKKEKTSKAKQAPADASTAADASSVAAAEQAADGSTAVIDDGRSIRLDALGDIADPGDCALARVRIAGDLAAIAVIPARPRGCACGELHHHQVDHNSEKV